MGDQVLPTIGLALSGGGMRATVFHLGVLQRLAADGLLERVTFLSTVSGGSIAVSLVYALSNWEWPSSNDYIQQVLPEASRLLTSRSLQRDYVTRRLTRPWLLPGGGAKLLSESLRSAFGIDAVVADLPTEPRWVINATTYETGKNWRFMPQRMGDYVLGYVAKPNISVAEAVAASAAYPGLIGPLVLKTSDFAWSSYIDGALTPSLAPDFAKVHLWDGGIYDNLGVEALFKPGGGNYYRDEYTFLIVSDASAPLPQGRSSFRHRPRRLVEIPMDQVRSLRSRILADYLNRTPNAGVYLRIGRSARYILEEALFDAQVSESVLADCMAKREVQAVAEMATDLRRLSRDRLHAVLRHGWEVADSTLLSRTPDLFEHMPHGAMEGPLSGMPSIGALVH